MTDEPTLKQLQERARELDIAGRSNLDREELVEAIAAEEARISSEGDLQPGTPEETGRPPLNEVAEQHAAIPPHRVIGGDDTDSEEQPA